MMRRLLAIGTVADHSGEALRGNEGYIQYEIMKKWNGRKMRQ